MAGHERFNQVPGPRQPKRDRKITLKAIGIVFAACVLYSPVLSLVGWFTGGTPTEQDQGEFSQLENEVGNVLLTDPAGFCSRIGFMSGVAPLVIPHDRELQTMQRKIKAARLGLWPWPVLPIIFEPMQFPVKVAPESWLAQAKFRIDPMKIEALETVSEPSVAREYLVSSFISVEKQAWKRKSLVSRSYTLKLGTDNSGLVVACKGSAVPPSEN